MLDADLAELYRVETRVLNQAVRRNEKRFPETFMFQLTSEEAAAMRSQSVTASKRNVRFQPLAFTEHGVAMLSAVLNSERAIQMSILVVNAFNRDLAERIGKLERGHDRTASVIEILVEDID